MTHMDYMKEQIKTKQKPAAEVKKAKVEASPTKKTIALGLMPTRF